MVDARNLKRVKKIIRNELGLMEEENESDTYRLDSKSFRRMKRHYRY